MNTPDTEWEKEAEALGVLQKEKEHGITPQPDDKNTPDTEWEKEEWGAWKFVSEMLDNPDEHGIYQTSKCYKQIYDFVVAQKEKAITSRDTYWKERVRKEVENEKKRIEAIFEQQVPPHAMDLEDSVWLKRLLNKAFGHE